MTEPPLDPQREYEALAEALQIFQAQESQPTPQATIRADQDPLVLQGGDDAGRDPTGG